MKIQEESVRICSVCKHRDFDPTCGVVCGLTKTKANFEDSCPDYDEDETQVTKLAEKAKVLEQSKSIRGWLAFFLWGGIGLGVLASLIIGIREIITEGYGFLFSCFCLVRLSILCIVSVCSILAFYRRRTNAVSLATIYLVMVLLDGLSQFALAYLFGEGTIAPQAMRQLAWGMVWFAFLQKSENVAELIPTSSRTWTRFEMIALAVYVAASTLILLSFVYVRTSNNPQNIFYTEDAYIRQNIENVNRNLPVSAGEDLVLKRVSLDGKNILYTIQMIKIFKTELQDSFLTETAETFKQDVLSGLRDASSDEFVSICWKNDYSIQYNYIDAISLPLFQVKITSEELKTAAVGY